ncbi:NPP1 family protein [Rhizobium leguminosarum]|uniref:NPP1 family protein n=1 Tax=Rhizobium leguminosarum TaxID=384 RepID=UPI001C91E6DD|nr:NPP1 family protein [Rhizobium leguminosarum]MBY2926963.1 necrosis-inducing protein [Rhizobium leguminosarum]MBY2937996.1 necrosis-inducing protein [Rhizobium leguminosarum]
MASVSSPKGRMLLTALMFVFVCGQSMPARAAHVIDHDKVQGFPDSTSGFLKTFQPYLQVHDGCVPFPAVDAAGNVSGGLKPSGLFANGGCSHNLGQIYVRAREYQGECGVMYAWFFPKEQIPNWPHKEGSRYNWEHVVVWLTSCDSEAQVNAVSYWSDDRYYITTTHLHMDGTHPLVAYRRYMPGKYSTLTHAFERGGKQPAVSWPGLTEEARQTLETYDFGMRVPFNSYNFDANLARAWKQGHGG